MLKSFKTDVSHQEVGRIVSEVEELFFASQAETLPVESIEHYLMCDLGYDNQDEFEDALSGTFVDFLRAMPNCTVTEQEDGKLVFSIATPEVKPAQTLELPINTRDDLWKIFLFAPGPARVCIPELEFEIQGPEKNVIDSLYNHLARAITNLEQHAQMNKGADSTSAILEAIEELRNCLDVEKPFTWVVDDPHGLCEINPAIGVKVTLTKKKIDVTRREPNIISASIDYSAKAFPIRWDAGTCHDPCDVFPW